MDSARQWAQAQGWEYRWLDDALFALLPDDLQPLVARRPVIASDLARLQWIQRLLADYDAVLWLDADVLIFAPTHLSPPSSDYAVGRELWVQAQDKPGWRVWKKVHNAALWARAQPQAAGRNAFVDFYADTALRLLRQNQAAMPDQFIGPKLLSALHSAAQLPVIESIGMLSPATSADLLGAGNGALAAMRSRQQAPLAAANLCRSSLHAGELSELQMNALIEHLLQQYAQALT